MLAFRLCSADALQLGRVWAVVLLPGALKHRLLQASPKGTAACPPLSPNVTNFRTFSASTHATSRFPLFLVLKILV